MRRWEAELSWGGCDGLLEGVIRDTKVFKGGRSSEEGWVDFTPYYGSIILAFRSIDYITNCWV